MASSSKHTFISDCPAIPLPKGWTDYTLLAVLHVITLARIIILNTIRWTDDKECDVLRLHIENDRLRSEIELLQRELQIKDARFNRVPSKKRPHYLPTERFEILVIKAMHGLSNEQTAKQFQIAVQTVVNWMRGIDKNETVQMPERTNRYPDFVRFAVQRLKLFCPMLGRYKIADILCRVGLHLSASTVKRMLDEPPQIPAMKGLQPDVPKTPTVRTQYPNHVWSIDLTVVSTSDGFWTPWSPNAVTQVHPYSWYVMVIIDHYTRRIMGFDVFEQNPTAKQIASSMERICNTNAAKPKYLISDKGTQFASVEFRSWCNENEIRQRFGAVGKHGSIAMTERAILTFKGGCVRRILTPVSKEEMVNETELFFDWYNEHRPHMSLKGKTPNDVYFKRCAAKPCIETRPRMQRVGAANKVRANIRIRLNFLEGRLHLPILQVEQI